MNRQHMTLALGGGGARGVAHLGVIEGLLEADCRIRRVVGVSIGSLAGAMYAFEPDIHRVQQRALDYLTSPRFADHQRELFGTRQGGDGNTGMFGWYHRVHDFLRAHRMMHRIVRQPSLLPGVLLQDVVEHLLPDADVSEAKIPLSIVAVDLHSGKQIVLERGPVRRAVQASSSLPGIFPPVEFDDMLLVDIGTFCALPLIAARSYRPQCLVAVDVAGGLKPKAECETALDVMMRMDEIGEAMFRHQLGDVADLTIAPDVSHVEWFNFTAAAELVSVGREAARAALPAPPTPLNRLLKVWRPFADSLRSLVSGHL